MALTLHLGIIDVPYSMSSYTATHSPKRVIGQAKRGKSNAPLSNAEPGTHTTGDVAGWLEDEYHVMEVFFEEHQEEIADAVAESYGGALENLLAGAPAGLNQFGDAESFIETKFKQFLSNKEMDSIGVAGVPTQAALRGVSHRFTHPYAKRGPRPSFIDTGLYQANFKSWID